MDEPKQQLYLLVHFSSSTTLYFVKFSSALEFQELYFTSCSNQHCLFYRLTSQTKATISTKIDLNLEKKTSLPISIFAETSSSTVQKTS